MRDLSGVSFSMLTVYRTDRAGGLPRPNTGLQAGRHRCRILGYGAGWDGVVSLARDWSRTIGLVLYVGSRDGSWRRPSATE